MISFAGETTYFQIEQDIFLKAIAGYLDDWMFLEDDFDDGAGFEPF